MGEAMVQSTRDEIMKRIGWISRRHMQLCDVRLDALGLGSGQVPVLMNLKHHPEMSQKELAEHMRVTAATISGTLKRMEKAGLIARAQDGIDARVTRVRLTDEGHARCAEAKRIFASTADEIFSPLSDEECERMLMLVERIELPWDRPDCGKHRKAGEV